MSLQKTLQLLSMIRRWLKNSLYQGLTSQIQVNQGSQYQALQEKASAIVFSPHFDDETLGCGGTIIKKVNAGAQVHIVFMTDGSTSHRHLIAEEKLKEMRSEEGQHAASILGVKPENVTLLGFKEGRLASRVAEAVKRVTELIADHDPDEVFVPHRREPLLWSADHLETRRIVLQALNQARRDLVIVEYPVWYWFHWPWVGVEWGKRTYRNIILRNTIAYSFGLDVKKDFNCCVPIADLLEQKRRALEQHKSQMTRLVPDNRWAILQDVAGGDFLRCFFSGFELFRLSKTADYR